MSQSPSMVSEDDNRDDVYLVQDDLGGRLGRARGERPRKEIPSASS
jgi:hypothetical protein